MAAIRDIFFQECDEQLGALESGLMAMEQGGGDADTVNAVFRAVHSIKGGAGAFALDALVRFAHVFETTLDHVRAGRMAATPLALKVMLRAADKLADLIRVARDGTDDDDSLTQALAQELRELNGSSARQAAVATAGTASADDDGMGDLVFSPLQVAFDDIAFAAGALGPVPADPSPSANRIWMIRFKPRPELYAKANETALLIRELASLGRVEVSVDCTALPDLAELDPEGAYLTWTVRLHTTCAEAEIRDVFEFVEDDCDLAINPERADQPVPHPSGMLADSDIMALIQRSQAMQANSTGDAATVAVTPAGLPQTASELIEGVAAMRTAPIVTRPESAPIAATIRVDLDRVDRLIDLVGELVINGSMLSQLIGKAGVARASGVAAALDDFEQLTREIQDSVMAIRAQPVRSVFQRMPRLVREVASMTGKQVRLATEGEATEVDKTVIERIADPLTHMIRNAIDHGLEPPEQRVAAGKPSEGVVRLSALHRSGRIVIEVADDGAGIDRDRVRAKAIENGVIAADAQLSEEETDNLIFLPGFSTASAVSDISGRGVGMDVVRRSVQALGGRISIVSRPGLGSTFILSLPLTLAVLDGMVVTVAGHTLIVPLGAMIESLQPRTETVHTLSPGVRVIALRGCCLPLIDVGLELGYRADAAEAEKSIALLVEGEDGVQAVLLVDTIQGQRQVVIKSLETNYRTIQGIAAATVMGDGLVALILDVDAIVSDTRGEVGRADPSRASGPRLLEAS